MTDARRVLAEAISKKTSHASIVIQGFDDRIERAKLVVKEVEAELARIDEFTVEAKQVRVLAMQEAIEGDDSAPIIETDNLLRDLQAERERVSEHDEAAKGVLKFLEDNRLVELRINREHGDKIRLASYEVLREEAQKLVDELVVLEDRREILRSQLQAFEQITIFEFDSVGRHVSVPLPTRYAEALNPVQKLYEAHLAPRNRSGAGWLELKSNLIIDASAQYSEPVAVPQMNAGPRPYHGPRPSLEDPLPKQSA
jgi:hypothetical protein